MTKIRKASKPSLREVVGGDIYEVWVDMLKRLVPSGRTHRLSVVVASMLSETCGRRERFLMWRLAESKLQADIPHTLLHPQTVAHHNQQ